MPADALEAAVLDQLAAVLSSPEVARSELVRASAQGGGAGQGARGRIVELERRRERLLRLHELGERHESYLTRELAALAPQLEAARHDLDGDPAVPGEALVEALDSLDETCAAVESWVREQATRGRLDEIAAALGITVRIERTDLTRGELTGVVPDVISHHCTNIGMTVRL